MPTCSFCDFNPALLCIRCASSPACDWCGGSDHVFDCGAAVAFGIMGMFHALRENLWQCCNMYGPDDPRASCRGQTRVPLDPTAEWKCWMCGAVE